MLIWELPIDNLIITQTFTMANCCQNVRGNKTKQRPKRQQKQTNKQTKQTVIGPSLNQQFHYCNLGWREIMSYNKSKRWHQSQSWLLYKNCNTVHDTVWNRTRPRVSVHKQGSFFRARQLIEQQTAYKRHHVSMAQLSGKHMEHL